jgi:hypothetical protein
MVGIADFYDPATFKAIANILAARRIPVQDGICTRYQFKTNNQVGICNQLVFFVFTARSQQDGQV